MYAIIRCGGRQYRAEVGESIVVEKLPYEVGEQIELEEVLLVRDGDKVHIGQPLVVGSRVKATIEEQFRGKKIIVYKYRPKQRYRRKQGHRQPYTRLRIDDIITGSKRRTKKAKEEEDNGS
jgi:large subunit ribosomal protein L21